MQKELEELLGEDLLKQIEEKIKGTLELKNIVSTAKGEYVPRDVMNQEVEKHKVRLQGEIDSLNEHLKERDNDLESLKDKAKKGEDASALIEDLQKKNKEAETSHKKELETVSPARHSFLMSFWSPSRIWRTRKIQLKTPQFCNTS